MNKELKIIDNKLYSIDENGNEIIRECVDNIDDILLKENIIEALENGKRELEYCSKMFNHEKIRDFIEISSPILSSILIPIIMSYLKDLPNVLIINGGIISREKYIALFIGLFTPLSIRISKEWYKEYKEELNNELGRVIAIDSYKRNILIQKEELKKIKKKSNKTDISKVDISNNFNIKNCIEINTIVSDINACYEFGINYKSVFEYYLLNNELPGYIKYSSSEENVKYLKNIIQENGKRIKIKRNRH